MIRTICAVCNVEIEVPAVGLNVCPSCGLDTEVSLKAPWNEAEVGTLLVSVLRVVRPFERRRGFVRGFMIGVAMTASAYWLVRLLG